MYVSLIGLFFLLILFLKSKLQSVERDLREQLSCVLAARDMSGPETWAHFHAQSRLIEGLLIKHFYTED
jgi:hypothetical protein